MSGHSKWSTIKRKKGASDMAKAKIFTKIGREITVCVRESGCDASTNGKLRDLIAKAKFNNVPNDNIDRVIKKAAGEGDKNDYVEMTYEGYGTNGVAVIVECLTDNKNRTAADVRHYFDKFGGNLGAIGCVSFMFNKQGVIIIDNEKANLDEDKVMEDCFEFEASDINFEDGSVEIILPSSQLHNAREELEKRGYIIMSAETEQVPTTYVSLTDDESIKKMNSLMEHLEDNDDVQNVWTNLED